MKEYLQVVKQVMSKFCTEKLAQVARGQNKHADSLATLASLMTEDVPRLIKVKLIADPSINTAVGIGVAVISTIESCWMDPIIDFLAKDRVPDDEKEANRVRRLASRYCCRQIVSYTGGLLGGRTFCAYTLRKLMNSWPSYMMKCVAVMWGHAH